MKRLTIILSLTLLCASAFAITQKGYVRTIKRPNSTVQRLSGVSIMAKGKNGRIVSDASGNFEIVFDGLKNGQPYSLQNILKSGYELQDKEIIGRVQPCSEIVPIEILMVNRDELEREKKRIAENARERAENEYIKKLDELDAELQQHKIQEQDYQHKIEELTDKYGRIEQLLDDMADSYARTDYAEMDSLTSMINQAIESGDIYYAERLLKLKGSVEDREAKVLSDRDALNQAQQHLDSLKITNARDIRDVADVCYNWYSIHLTRFNRDSARYFILKRAELDTTNAEYQLQAAQFLLIYSMEYELAIKYDERALRIATSRNGRINGNVATALNDIAASYQNMGRLDEAENYMNQALDIRRKLLGDKDKSIAESYNNIGTIYINRGEYSKAEKYLQKAIDIRQKLTGKENSYELAKCELNLAGTYAKQGKNEKAIALLMKVLPALQVHDGENSTEVANCYNTLGVAYYFTKEYETSAQYLEKSYLIFKKIKGENHHQTKEVEANLKAVKELI